MVNGYVTLDLASKNIYKEALGAIKSGKPVMVVDAPNVYFADTIATATIDDDVVVQITKGGKTITINDANAVSSEGEIQIDVKPLYLHEVKIVYESTIIISGEFVSRKSSYTKSEFLNFIKENYTSDNNIFALSGTYASTNFIEHFVGIYWRPENSIFQLPYDKQTFTLNDSNISIGNSVSGYQTSGSTLDIYINSKLI